MKKFAFVVLLFLCFAGYCVYAEDGEKLFASSIEELKNPPPPPSKSGSGLIASPITIVPSDKDKQNEASIILDRIVQIFEKYPELNISKELYLKLEKENLFINIDDILKIRRVYYNKLTQKGYTI